MTQQAGPRTMHIGELADRTELSHRTIRHYDEVGLLPASARTGGGFRVYTEADYARLMLIRKMKPLGFSLEEMAELLPLMEPAMEPSSDGTGDDGTGDDGTGDDGSGATSDSEATSGSGVVTDSDRSAELLERARRQREKMARNLAGADEFIVLLERRVDEGPESGTTRERRPA